MKDATGKTLSVGDRVVTNQKGYTSDLATGVIEGFTEKKVRIRLTNKVWKYSEDTCLKFPEQCAKVE